MTAVSVGDKKLVCGAGDEPDADRAVASPAIPVSANAAEQSTISTLLRARSGFGLVLTAMLGGAGRA